MLQTLNLIINKVIAYEALRIVSSLYGLVNVLFRKEELKLNPALVMTDEAYNKHIMQGAQNKTL